MLQKSTIDFLTKLGKNNNKPWFDKNRAVYETAKEDFEVFVTNLKDAMTKIEPAFKEQKAKDMVFRIFRDVRFSKDKTPYKAHFGAYLSKGGKKSPAAGYYFHLEPGKSFVAGGVWMPENAILKSLRQEIDYNLKEFKGILNNASFKKLYKKLEGEQLKTVPQGYNAENPAIEYLKMKSFIVTTKIDDKDLLSKTAIAKTMKSFIVMKPLVDFLNRAMD
jgi:uncharacterized protein (TIGR02453 family)